MYAVQNLPGSQHFDYFKGTKAECRQWGEEQKEKFPFNGEIRFHPNKEVEAWRWGDGSHIIRREY